YFIHQPAEPRMAGRVILDEDDPRAELAGHGALRGEGLVVPQGAIHIVVLQEPPGPYGRGGSGRDASWYAHIADRGLIPQGAIDGIGIGKVRPRHELIRGESCSG